MIPSTFKSPFIIYYIDDDVDDFIFLNSAITAKWPEAEVIHYTESSVFVKLMPSLKIPAIVISDWYMPMLSGKHIISAIKNSVRWKDIPIIIVSTEISKPIQIDLEKQGIKFFPKPFSVDEWRSLIELLENISSVFNVSLNDSSQIKIIR